MVGGVEGEGGGVLEGDHWGVMVVAELSSGMLGGGMLPRGFTSYRRWTQFAVHVSSRPGSASTQHVADACVAGT